MMDSDGEGERRIYGRRKTSRTRKTVCEVYFMCKYVTSCSFFYVLCE